MLRLPCVLLLSATLAQAQAPEPAVAAEPDQSVELTDDDIILYGTPRRALSPTELFAALGRQDLVDQAAANRSLRTTLFIVASVVATVALGVGIGLFVTAPPPSCGFGDLAYLDSYCQPQWALHNQSGAFVLAAGLGAAGVIAGIGFWTRPDVLSRNDLLKFIHQHNASSGKPLAQLRVLPWMGPDGGGLLARGTF